MHSTPLKTLLLIIISTAIAIGQATPYTWLDSYDSKQAIITRIAPPDSFTRVKTAPGSFGKWLQHLPLKQGNPPIYLHNGEKKNLQEAHCAVVDIDTGTDDLQQCADAVIRLRAEYLYAIGLHDSIAFNFTSGDLFRYRDWLDGKTPVISHNKVSWQQQSARENNRATFHKYLKIIFTYAGSYSLSRELVKVADIDSIQPGDIFIQGGFPGHAMLVVDVAYKQESGEKIFLLAQSYMPAQDIHIVCLPNGGPWFAINTDGKLITREWIFNKTDLKRFK